MHYDLVMGDKVDHGKIVCRLCGRGISFASSSLTSAGEALGQPWGHM